MKFLEYYMLLEKRRWQRPTPYAVLEKYKDDPNIFVSFTSDFSNQPKHRSGEKLGINPRTRHRTPIGIYTYPLQASFNEYFTKLEDIPYMGKSPNVFIVRPKNPNRIARGSTYTQKDFNRDAQRLVELLVDEPSYPNPFGGEWTIEEIEGYLENADEKYKETPIQCFWTVCRMLSTQNIVKWASLMFQLYDGLVDDLGQGFIHEAEKKQAVFFNRSVLEVVEMIKKKGSEWSGGVNPMYDAQRAKFHEALKGDRDFVNRATIYFTNVIHVARAFYTLQKENHPEANNIYNSYKDRLADWIAAIFTICRTPLFEITHLPFRKICRDISEECHSNIYHVVSSMEQLRENPESLNEHQLAYLLSEVMEGLVEVYPKYDK